MFASALFYSQNLFGNWNKCFYYQECNLVAPFLNAGKAVFETEYTDDGMTLPQFCPQANAMNINALLKQRNLGAWLMACR
jgi:glycosyl hydrolase family 114